VCADGADVTLLLADRRNLGTLEQRAKEILRQVAFLRRNGDGDQLRFGLIRAELRKALQAATYGYNRRCRELDKRRNG